MLPLQSVLFKYQKPGLLRWLANLAMMPVSFLVQSASQLAKCTIMLAIFALEPKKSHVPTVLRFASCALDVNLLSVEAAEGLDAQLMTVTARIVLPAVAEVV